MKQPQGPDMMNAIICDNCQSGNLTLNLVVDQYKLYKCKDCTLVKLYPNPDKEELQKLYSGLDRNIAKGAVLGEILAFKENSSQFISALNSMRIEPIKQFFPTLSTASYICDVGCGGGIYLAALQKLGYTNLYGIEYNNDNVELINQNFSFRKVVQGEIKQHQDIPKVDLITAFDVIEHVPDPANVIREMYSMLNDEGYIHLRVPNYGSLWAKVFGKKWLWMIPPFHLNYFSHGSLKNMVERNGFEIIKVRSRRSGFRIAFWFLQLKTLLTKNIDSFSTSSYSKKTFVAVNAVEMIFRFFYIPVYLVAQLFNADDCLELYAKKVKK